MQQQQPRHASTVTADQTQASSVRLFDSVAKKHGFTTAQDSKQFLKRITAVTISTVAYLRGMFPGESFGVKTLEGLNFKVLKSGEDQHPGAKCLIDQLMSVFKVIDEAELREIELAVYSEPECHADNLLEVWSFRCGCKPEPTVERESAQAETPRWLVDLPDDSLDGTRSATMAMLQTLLEQTMLPPLHRAILTGSAHSRCYLVMKVSHTVPQGSPEIVLHNIKKVDADSALFSDETVKVAIGAIPTKHLGLKVAVKARPCAHEAAGLGLGVDHDSQDADAASTAPTPVLSRKATMDPPVVPTSLKKSKRGRSATNASLRSTKSSSVAVGSAVPTRSSKALSKPATGREQMTSTNRQKKRLLSRFRQGIQFRQAVVCFIAVIIFAGVGVFAYLATTGKLF
eukprot:m.349418 g.349418  ORF g.349418 m.349418 type:complete len:400 (+) comp27950_c0_seq13:1760-2959(+)